MSDHKKPNAFGIMAELKVVSVLLGREIQRLPILWTKPDKIISTLRTPEMKLIVDNLVLADLPTTQLVEPTSREFEFRRTNDLLLDPSTNSRHILLNCSNVEKCSFKLVVKMAFNEETGGWGLLHTGDLADGCPKCRYPLYSCGKSVIAHTLELNGWVKCKCVQAFNALNFNIAVPKTKNNLGE